ncbi:MAG: hypothetical protein IKB42_03525 [Clostridia bacterium]|nr:hypothetical protein [Clostridia bacterium]
MAKVKSYEEEVAKIENDLRKNYEKSLKHLTKEEKLEKMKAYDEMVEREKTNSARYKQLTKSLENQRTAESEKLEKMTEDEEMEYWAKELNLATEDVKNFNKVKSVRVKKGE